MIKKFRLGDIIIPISDGYLKERYTITGFYDIGLGKIHICDELIIDTYKPIKYYIIVDRVINKLIKFGSVESCDNFINPRQIDIDILYTRKLKIKCLKKVMK